MGRKVQRRLSPAVLVLSALAAALVLLPARASADTFTYQLTITESAQSSNYGDPSPTFRASLTEPSDDPPLSGNTPFYVTVDSTDYVGSLSGSYPTYSLYQSGVVSPPLAVGQHSVVARYQSPNHGWLTSTPVVFTVLKTTPVLECSFVNFTGSYATNASIAFDASFGNTNAPVDIQNGTFTLVFAGAQTFSDSNLVANGAGRVTASAPSVPGTYTLTCAFSGTSSFNAVSYSAGIILVSLYNPVGGVALYTQPAPIAPGATATWEVVVTGRPGQPTPTGSITVTIENTSTSGVPPLSGGVTTFTAVTPTFVPSATILVAYSGDTFYAPTADSFPVSTLPIPTTASPTPSSRPSPSVPSPQSPTKAPASPSPAPLPSPTPAETATPTASQGASPSPTHRFNPVLTKSVGPPGNRFNVAASLVGITGFVALVGLASRLAWRRRQRGG